ncbi:MAG: lysylphosphatidylglycerol synthase domain-containing protein [Chloroflexi bacterium]|nr:lysylphosphatidylglycerol synthase domain-containing protein [Chloroflexota bacterium]MCL5275410.1 lysylphosphatidylglycerol synthase domain-containing protein [Chloroflexota bacterium]
MLKLVATRWKTILQWAVTLGLVLFLLAQIPLHTLADLLAHVNLAGVLLGAAIYLLNNVIRALRVVRICDLPYRDTRALLTPVLASSFGNNVLPARAGEPIFIWAAHQRLGLSWGTSSAVMVIMRVFDTMLVAIIFVFAAIVTGAAESSLILWVVTVALGAAVVVTALLPWLGGYLVNLLVGLVRLTRKDHLIAFIEHEGRRAADAFVQLRAPRIYAGVFFTSLVIWLLTFGWIYVLMRSLGIDVQLNQSVLGSTFGILSKAVPFSSIGGWGAHEVGWTAGFTLIGFPTTLAISSGFAVNTLIILTSAVCGLPAWLALSSDQRREEATASVSAHSAASAPVDPPARQLPAQLSHKPLRLFVQICALNEQETIGQVICDIPRTVEGVASVQVLVVDDGSSDNTALVAAQAGADLIVRHHRNKGLARAFQTGIDNCLALGADIIVNIDADGQYEAADIATLIRPIVLQQADMVIGDRQVQAMAHFTPAKRLFQWLGSHVVQAAAGVNVPDAVSGFRAYSREAALRMFVTGTFSYTVQTLIQAGKLGLAVSSVPIRARETTRPSRLHRGMLHFMSHQAVILVRTYVTYEPLKTFSALSLPFLLFGTVLIVRLLIFAAEQGGQLIGRVQSLVVGTISIVIGLLLLITGVIADRVRENRHLLEEIMYRVRLQSAQRSEPAAVAEPGEPLK